MKVTIIGGGIIGLFSAYYLNKEGFDVKIFEQTEGKDGCSFGNAGMIVPSHFIPLAAPGMFEKGFQWMLDSQSPFYVKPRLDWSLINWGIQFKKAATHSQVNKAMPVLRDIALLSRSLYQELGNSDEIQFGLEEKGLVLYCQSESILEEEVYVAKLAGELGLEAQVLNPMEISNLEPLVNVNALGAVFYPGDMHANPGQLVRGLKQLLISKGVSIHYNSQVLEFSELPDGRCKIMVNQGGEIKKFLLNHLLLATGAWSQHTAEMFGLRLPMQAGKGYSFLQNNSGLKVPSILVDGRVAVTPFSDGTLRVGGTMEISGIHSKNRINRVKGIVRTYNSFFPDKKTTEPALSEVWQGLRPCSPDGLPYIGKLQTFKNVFIATGHAMMGLSLAPATGRVITDKIMNRKELVDCTLFEPHRFDRRN